MPIFRTPDGLAIHYRETGKGRPVVFLHPIGTRGEFWDPAIEALGDGHRVITVDLRGFGESDVPARPFSLTDMAGDVTALMRALEVKDAIVVGCSLGGMVAQGVTLSAPALVSGLVLTGAGHTQSAESKAVMTKRSEEALQGMQSVADATIERWFPAPFRAQHPDKIAPVRKWLLQTDPKAFSLAWLAIRDLNYGQRLAGISVPALLIRGAEDAATPLPRMQEMAGLLPQATFVIMPDAGHLAPYQQPKEFAALLSDLIGKTRRPD